MEAWIILLLLSIINVAGHQKLMDIKMLRDILSSDAVNGVPHYKLACTHSVHVLIVVETKLQITSTS